MKSKIKKLAFGFASFVLTISGGSFLGVAVCYGIGGGVGVAIVCLAISLVCNFAAYATGLIVDDIED